MSMIFDPIWSEMAEAESREPESAKSRETGVGREALDFDLPPSRLLSNMTDQPMEASSSKVHEPLNGVAPENLTSRD